MRQVYIVGDISQVFDGSLTIYDALTHKEIALKEAYITILPGRNPTIDFFERVPGSTEHRAQVVPAPTLLTPKVEDKDEEVCGHTGWVSHDVQGDNRFWCRECDERFINHPLVAKKKQGD